MLGDTLRTPTVWVYAICRYAMPVAWWLQIKIHRELWRLTAV